MRSVLIAFIFLITFSCPCGAKATKSFAAEDIRIVSLSPAITGCLYDLKNEDKIVGVTLYCKAAGKEVVGTLLEPSIEKIVSLEPDLILAEAESTSRAMIDKLKGLGLNVAVIEPANSFKKICDNFILIAELTGRIKEARAIVLNVNNKVDTIYLKAMGLPKEKIFWQLGIRPLVTVNDKTYVSDLIKFAGGVNLFSDAVIVYPPVSYEEVIRRGPDIIIITGMGEAMQEEALRWHNFKSIEAAKNSRIFVLDPYLVCQPTPIKFLKGLEELAKLIHPEDFK